MTAAEGKNESSEYVLKLFLVLSLKDGVCAWRANGMGRGGGAASLGTFNVQPVIGEDFHERLTTFLDGPFDGSPFSRTTSERLDQIYMKPDAF